MANSIAKQNILNRIKQALSNPVPLPFAHEEDQKNVFKQSELDTAALFEENFRNLQGKFFLCNNIPDFKIQLQQLIQIKQWSKIFCKETELEKILQSIAIESYDELSSCDSSVTGCENLVARTGTIVMSSAQQSGRTTSVYAPIHICIAYTHQLVYDLKDSFKLLESKYSDNWPSLMTFASGPSRTADIEKTLVTGVHGPKEVYCFLIQS